MRSGRGVMRFRDGTRYAGEWLDDDMNGQGVMTLPNGERYEGLFVNGEWRGPARAQPLRRCCLYGSLDCGRSSA